MRAGTQAKNRVAEASALSGVAQGLGSEGSVIKIIRQRPISTARAAHSGEDEILKKKTCGSIVEWGKNYGKTVEITGNDCRCKICNGLITMQSGRPFCEDCGYSIGGGVIDFIAEACLLDGRIIKIPVFRAAKPDKQNWRGGGAFMRTLIHH